LIFGAIKRRRVNAEREEGVTLLISQTHIWGRGLQRDIKVGSVPT